MIPTRDRRSGIRRTDRLSVLELFEPPDGGVAQHVLQVTQGLRERGHEVVVGGPASAVARGAIERAGARFEPLPLVGNMVAPLRDGAGLRAIATLLRSTHFDLVHTHSEKAGILGRICANRSATRTIHSPHGFGYRNQLLRPRRSAGARYRLTLAVERRLGARTAALVACAQEERAAALRDRIVDADHVVVVRYGVAPDPGVEPDSELMAFREQGPLFGFVSTLREQKGLPVLLDALELLARQREPVRFAIVGNGPLEGMVRERISRPPLEGAVLLRPFGVRPEPYLGALDALVLPSYWEGLPIAVLEAMALGLPVIASAVNGTPEAVRDGETGYLFPSGDAAALAGRMKELIDDPEARERLGRRGRAVARDEFGAARMIDGLLLVYQAVAEQRPLPASTGPPELR